MDAIKEAKIGVKCITKRSEWIRPFYLVKTADIQVISEMCWLSICLTSTYSYAECAFALQPGLDKAKGWD